MYKDRPWEIEKWSLQGGGGGGGGGGGSVSEVKMKGKYNLGETRSSL